MNEPLIARRLAIVPTSKCTLRCKLCCNFLNGPVNQRSLPLENVCRDVDRCFELIDHVEWLQFVGGEVFLYPEFPQLLNYVKKYRERFDRIIIESNATIFPNQAGQDAITQYGKDISVFISDYGELSRARDRFVSFFEDHDIDYKLKKYHGENQYFDGWIDNNNPHDLHEPGDVLEVNARHCPQFICENMHCYDGKLFRCASSCFMQDMGVFPPKQDDFVDLNDDTVSREHKREVISRFYDFARRSCRYCKFKYIGILPRHPAAEQLAPGETIRRREEP